MLLALQHHQQVNLPSLPSPLQVAENLALFRRWCFATYGGVAIAFHALDADGSGSLSEEEFVTVIEHSSFKGDARAAWNALNLEGSDILSEAWGNKNQMEDHKLYTWPVERY